MDMQNILTLYVNIWYNIFKKGKVRHHEKIFYIG